ncbi:MAG TPA: hypothetical protein VF095_08110 [Bacillota bacterium]
MSDKKKVIHVRDLVIKADRVFIRPQRPKRGGPPWDPFMGRRSQQASEEIESENVHFEDEQKKD